MEDMLEIVHYDEAADRLATAFAVPRLPAALADEQMREVERAAQSLGLAKVQYHLNPSATSEAFAKFCRVVTPEAVLPLIWRLRAAEGERDAALQALWSAEQRIRIASTNSASWCEYDEALADSYGLQDYDAWLAERRGGAQ